MPDTIAIPVKAPRFSLPAWLALLFSIIALILSSAPYLAPFMEVSRSSRNLGFNYVPEPNMHYMVCYTITGRSKGFINLRYGGVNIMGEGDSVVTFDIWRSACKGVTALARQPGEMKSSSDFDGKLDITLQSVQKFSPPESDEANQLRKTTRNSLYVGADAGRLDIKGSHNIGIGMQALASVVTGHGNIAIGSASLAQGAGSRSNVAVGHSAMSYNTTGYNNTAVGNGALLDNETGFDNVGVGVNALVANISGQNNTGVGTDSFESNISGQRNTGLGAYSARRNISSSFNTTAGYASMYHYQGIVGANSAFGVNALGALKDGGRNAALGLNAGVSVISAIDSTWIGTEAGADPRQSKEIANATAIGANAWTDANNQISLGNEQVREVRTWGVLALQGGRPITGADVAEGSLFRGADGGLYFKGPAGVVRLDAALERAQAVAPLAPRPVAGRERKRGN